MNFKFYFSLGDKWKGKNIKYKIHILKNKWIYHDTDINGSKCLARKFRVTLEGHSFRSQTIIKSPIWVRKKLRSQRFPSGKAIPRSPSRGAIARVHSAQLARCWSARRDPGNWRLWGHYLRIYSHIKNISVAGMVAFFFLPIFFPLVLTKRKARFIGKEKICATWWIYVYSNQFVFLKIVIWNKNIHILTLYSILSWPHSKNKNFHFPSRVENVSWKQ